MKPQCAKVKNPCKFCLQAVSNKNGIQCMGACKKWAHFKCLHYTPGKISDIKAGVLKVTCPCPNCNTSQAKEFLTNPPYSCSNHECPVHKLPKCSSLDCPVNRKNVVSFPSPPSPEYKEFSSPSPCDQTSSASPTNSHSPTLLLPCEPPRPVTPPSPRSCPPSPPPCLTKPRSTTPCKICPLNNRSCPPSPPIYSQKPPAPSPISPPNAPNPPSSSIQRPAIPPIKPAGNPIGSTKPESPPCLLQSYNSAERETTFPTQQQHQAAQMGANIGSPTGRSPSCSVLSSDVPGSSSTINTSSVLLIAESADPSKPPCLPDSQQDETSLQETQTENPAKMDNTSNDSSLLENRTQPLGSTSSTQLSQSSKDSMVSVLQKMCTAVDLLTSQMNTFIKRVDKHHQC